MIPNAAFVRAGSSIALGKDTFIPQMSNFEIKRQSI